MTAVITPESLPVPEPRRPWRNPMQTLRQRVVVFAIAAAIASILYAVTGLDGLLGWYVAFALSTVVAVAVQSFFTGRKSLSDRIASAVITIGFATVVIPWISLVFTVINRG